MFSPFGFLSPEDFENYLAYQSLNLISMFSFQYVTILGVDTCCMQGCLIWNIVTLQVSCGIHVADLFSFLCCPIMCLCVLCSVLICPLRFPHKNDVQFVFTSSCLIYVICVCLGIVASNTYCVVFLFCFSSSFVHYVSSFSGVSIIDCPFSIL